MRSEWQPLDWMGLVQLYEEFCQAYRPKNFTSNVAFYRKISQRCCLSKYGRIVFTFIDYCLLPLWWRVTIPSSPWVFSSLAVRPWYLLIRDFICCSEMPTFYCSEMLTFILPGTVRALVRIFSQDFMVLPRVRDLATIESPTNHLLSHLLDSNLIWARF